MTDSHDSSLLFSLAELRRIEDQRIAEEAMAAELALADARRAAEEAEARRSAEAAAERRRVQEAERIRTERLEAERRREWLALEERERLAVIAAEERLASERLASERALRPSRNRAPLLVAIAALGVALVALAFLHVDQRDDLAAASARLEETTIEASATHAALASAQGELAVAREQINKLVAEVGKLREQATRQPGIAPTAARQPTRRPPRRTRVTPAPEAIDATCASSPDPLCGIDR